MTIQRIYFADIKLNEREDCHTYRRFTETSPLRSPYSSARRPQSPVPQCAHPFCFIEESPRQIQKENMIIIAVLSYSWLTDTYVLIIFPSGAASHMVNL